MAICGNEVDGEEVLEVGQSATGVFPSIGVASCQNLGLRREAMLN